MKLRKVERTKELERKEERRATYREALERKEGR